MKRLKGWLKRIKGALGLGLTWAAAWAGFLSIVTVVADMIGGYAWTPTVVNLLANAALFAIMGFIGGASFSVVLGIAERRRTFDELSLPRFAAWGAAGGVALAVLMSATSVGGLTLGGLLGTGVVGALLGAGSATGSLALARRGEDRSALDAGDTAGLIGGR